ncbi:Ubiquitin thioesterase OTU1 isoform A [Micractinium conductrix]|uniref:Ubiquitin thioesterase OTU n=1 Tax=Micractinium conductrix TaxID=554055 RepID=A0A2P6VPS1_9CHLO|nr:Ubiquitin thioesterase OTU1 isoform B [Micractinium conductrix]PSC76057.1 Ubiquitin thioesterase OTU1 isoform A [Micractinium conductrix]|eukprot:PSC76056.1 Ubiquitin thioesterase OTU1 isoform B [Micractinium conductrix]
MALNLRVRGPEGQVTLKVEPSATAAEFRQLLADKTGVPADRQEVRGGFPPKPLQWPADGGATVASLGVQSGDSLTVTALPGSAAAAPGSNGAAPTAAAASNGHPAAALAGLSEDEQLARAIALSMGQALPDLPAAAPPRAAAPPAVVAAAPTLQRRVASPARAHPAGTGTGGGGGAAPTSIRLPDGTAVTRRIIDSDNSCLFNAVGYVTQHSRKLAPQLRQVIADAVLGDPFEWNEAVLGKEPAEYCRWIKDPSKWGGAIELSILSQHLKAEIAAFDIQTKRCDVYGQGAGYCERVMLIYDGLHYDALAVAAFHGAPESQDVTRLPSSGPRCEAVMAGAAALTEAAHKARQFTDTANFTLRCGVCQIGLKGEKEAVEHAKTSGHTNFSEY